MIFDGAKKDLEMGPSSMDNIILTIMCHRLIGKVLID
jgi:hypothetical protein